MEKKGNKQENDLHQRACQVFGRPLRTALMYRFGLPIVIAEVMRVGPVGGFPDKVFLLRR